MNFPGPFAKVVTQARPDGGGDFPRMAFCPAPAGKAAEPAVVVLGGLNGLGITRSLRQGTVPTCVVDTDLFSPAMWSRAVRPVRARGITGEGLIDTLLELQRSIGGRPVLFNSHEMAVLSISEHRRKLAQAFRFRLPEHETVLALQDKMAFHALATAMNLPVPRGAILQVEADIEPVLRSLRFPIVVKPADKGAVHSGKARGVTVFADFGAARAGCEAILAQAGGVIAQEWIEGGSDRIYFCLFYRGRGGTIVSMFTGRKLASSPPGIGVTAYCTAAPEARDILEPMTTSILERLDYAGMGSIEYKWDAATRRFFIIEPTVGRTDWQEEIATLCGVNIPLQAYCHELELRPPACDLVTEQVIWRSSWIEPLKAQAPSLPAAAQVYDGYWRRDDPMPAIIHYSYGLLGAVNRRLRNRFKLKS